MYLDEFADRLNELIAEAGIEVSDLPELLGVDRKSVRLWRSGKNFPNYKHLITLMDYFHVRADYLLGLEDCFEEVATENVIKDWARVQREFSLKVKAYMDREHLTIYAIAKKVNIDQKAFKRLLVAGAMPETATLIRIAQLMEVSVHDLLGCK